MSGGEQPSSAPPLNELDRSAIVEMRRRASARAAIRVAGLMLGLALVAIAMWYASRDEATIKEIAAALRSASPLAMAGLAACVLLNVALTGALFSVLTSRYGRVGLVEMQALTASTALLNFLPLRPGLFGRVAYHRLVNGIAIRDTAKVIVASILLTMVASLCLLGSIVASIVLHVSLPIVVGAVALVPAALLLDRRFRWAASAFLIRLADVIVWAMRYSIMFELIGRPIGFDAALALAVISIFATMVPFLSNGLGLREWAIGLAAPILVDTLGSVTLDGRIAIGAELVHRGMEIIVIGACGGLGLLYLSARKRRSIAGPEQEHLVR